MATMNLKLTPGSVFGALAIALALWVLHGFFLPVLVGCVTALASWPLYTQFAAHLHPRLARSTVALLFTMLVVAFVLAPLMFAFGAMLTEAHALLAELRAADRTGLAVPSWLDGLPLAGPWLASRWQGELAHPGALLAWAQRADAAALFGWAQSLSHFVARQILVVSFSALVLFFLYEEGESLGEQLRRVLRQGIGDRAERYVALTARALRASVNSMLVVSLLVGFATWLAYAIAGVPHAAVWAAITGSLGLVPFLGYAAVAALTLHLAIIGATAPALASLGLGCAILFCGDKILRPLIAREGTRLPFVWILMGCLGGFEVLGPVGLVIGPVALALTRELWVERGLAAGGADNAARDQAACVSASSSSHGDPCARASASARSTATFAPEESPRPRAIAAPARCSCDR